MDNAKSSLEFVEVGKGFVVGELSGELLRQAREGRRKRRIQQLEREVIEAAVAQPKTREAWRTLDKAVEALLRERATE